jgi:hypothetical protein
MGNLSNHPQHMDNAMKISVTGEVKSSSVIKQLNNYRQRTASVSVCSTATDLQQSTASSSRTYSNHGPSQAMQSVVSVTWISNIRQWQ